METAHNPVKYIEKKRKHERNSTTAVKMAERVNNCQNPCNKALSKKWIFSLNKL